MISTVSTQDGGLGFQASDAPAYFVGPATSGATDAVQTVGDPSTVYGLYGGGKLPDRTAFHFSIGGGGPVSLLRMAASTAGAIASYTGYIADARAGNSATNTFANLSFTGPRNVEVVFAANYDGGNVTVTGTDAAGAAQTETITASAGNTVRMTVNSCGSKAMASAMPVFPEVASISVSPG